VKGLFLELDPHALLAQLSGTQIHFKTLQSGGCRHIRIS
jgi:hypothetical protein